MIYERILRKKPITWKDRVNEIGWPPVKGVFNELYSDIKPKCHICGLKTVRDLRPIPIKKHGSITNITQWDPQVECIRCILTGGGECDLGYPTKRKYANKEQMVEVSACRKMWQEHDKYEIIGVY